MIELDHLVSRRDEFSLESDELNRSEHGVDGATILNRRIDHLMLRINQIGDGFPFQERRHVVDPILLKKNGGILLALIFLTEREESKTTRHPNVEAVGAIAVAIGHELQVLKELGQHAFIRKEDRPCGWIDIWNWNGATHLRRSVGGDVRTCLWIGFCHDSTCGIGEIHVAAMLVFHVGDGDPQAD